MHDFADMDEVEHVLESLAQREPALVARMARGRWAQLLGGTPEVSTEPDAPMLASTSATALEERVAALEREVAELKQKLAGLL
jgi:uncharacterized protein YceH (UPF0502 family)